MEDGVLRRGWEHLPLQSLFFPTAKPPKSYGGALGALGFQGKQKEWGGHRFGGGSGGPNASHLLLLGALPGLTQGPLKWRIREWEVEGLRRAKMGARELGNSRGAPNLHRISVWLRNTEKPL